jgi:hypothetical protein
MVLTRSGAKREQAAEVERLTAEPKPTPLAHQSTLVEVTPSATGLPHLRWLLEPQFPNEMPEVLSSDMTQDPRFVTPAPETPVTTPPKLSPQRRIGNPGIVNTGTPIFYKLFPHEVDRIAKSARAQGGDFLSEFERYLEERSSSDTHNNMASTDTFGHSFHYNAPAVPSACPPTPIIADFAPTYNAVKLGPHGTELVIWQNDVAPNYNQTSRGLTSGGMHRGGVRRGLGPNDTVLIGPDGRAIVPGIRPGY